jgi:5'-methylthioadenosine phosphorylase
MSKIAIIGGLGLEMPDYLENVRKVTVNTPFGLPDPLIFSGFFNGIEVVHLSRHGNGKDVPPLKINYKANLYALKQQSCSHILATVTCRSLQEEICPGEIIIPDQFIDLTTQSISGFYDDLNPGEGVYGPMHDPFSCELCDHLVEAAIVKGITVHTKGIVLSINGPRYSSRAESNLYRGWGADVINMFTAPEVILANELGMSYASVALCTGYDSWRNCDEDFEPENDSDILVRNHDKIMHMLTYAIRKLELQ